MEEAAHVAVNLGRVALERLARRRRREARDAEAQLHVQVERPQLAQPRRARRLDRSAAAAAVGAQHLVAQLGDRREEPRRAEAAQLLRRVGGGRERPRRPLEHRARRLGRRRVVAAQRGRPALLQLDERRRRRRLRRRLRRRHERVHRAEPRLHPLLERAHTSGTAQFSSIALFASAAGQRSRNADGGAGVLKQSIESAIVGRRRRS